MSSVPPDRDTKSLLPNGAFLQHHGHHNAPHQLHMQQHSQHSVAPLVVGPLLACLPSRNLFTWTSHAMKLGCTSCTTNVLLSRRSFILALLDQLGMLGMLCLSLCRL